MHSKPKILENLIKISKIVRVPRATPTVCCLKFEPILGGSRGGPKMPKICKKFQDPDPPVHQGPPRFFWTFRRQVFSRNFRPPPPSGANSGFTKRGIPDFGKIGILGGPGQMAKFRAFWGLEGSDGCTPEFQTYTNLSRRHHYATTGPKPKHNQLTTISKF